MPRLRVRNWVLVDRETVVNVLPMILPDWFYAGVIDDALVLTIAPPISI